jgi:hypothetical protein
VFLPEFVGFSVEVIEFLAKLFRTCKHSKYIFMQLIINVLRQATCCVWPLGTSAHPASLLCKAGTEYRKKALSTAVALCRSIRGVVSFDMSVIHDELPDLLTAWS